MQYRYIKPCVRDALPGDDPYCAGSDALDITGRSRLYDQDIIFSDIDTSINKTLELTALAQASSWDDFGGHPGRDRHLRPCHHQLHHYRSQGAFGPYSGPRGRWLAELPYCIGLAWTGGPGRRYSPIDPARDCAC